MPKWSQSGAQNEPCIELVLRRAKSVPRGSPKGAQSKELKQKGPPEAQKYAKMEPKWSPKWTLNRIGFEASSGGGPESQK